MDGVQVPDEKQEKSQQDTVQRDTLVEVLKRLTSASVVCHFPAHHSPVAG